MINARHDYTMKITRHGKVKYQSLILAIFIVQSGLDFESKFKIIK